MADQLKVHSDYQPVMNFDQPTYTTGSLNAVASGKTVQPQGPKLDFFTITASGSSAFSTTQVDVMIKTIQQLATVYIYEYTDASNDTLAVAVYPTGAWTTTALDTAFTAAGVASTSTATGATFGA